ncbi:ricin-type beta-trefoil lectin domain protein [Streptomyces niveiscabiei]|uniref:RICIN domain-containing protein n=1 Tax=Streptomyces niveiscabiei TaxID=164115 RepID=UPI0029A51F08|nr:RICIN domain-containing protein [Streptomyces niveiscabiei]MDX3381823.1 ricin-type beta-trefoil lectin domain protein [Streptomyces niveiscabiei]
MVRTEELNRSTQAPVRTSLRHFARRGSTAALAVGMSVGALFMSTTPASAYVGENFLRNWETGRCLDADDTGSIYTLPCQQGNAYQTWQPIYVRHDTYDVVQVKNKATGRCLHVNAHGALTTYWCDESGNPNWNQRFAAKGSGWDRIELTNVLFNTCVDSNHAGAAYVTGCNGGGYQKWKLGF